MTEHLPNRIGDVQSWHVSDDFAGWCVDLSGGSWLERAALIKENRLRRVYRVPASQAILPDLVIKQHCCRSFADWLKSRVRCKAREEYDAGIQLGEAGVQTPRMVGWGVDGDDTFVAMEEISEACSFQSALSLAKAGGDEQLTEFLEKLAAFLLMLFRAGADHPDMHQGNILCRGSGAELEFYLVDVYGVRTGTTMRVGRAHRLLAWLDDILFSAGEKQTRAFLNTVLAETPGLQSRVNPGNIHAFRSAAVRARWRGRKKRMLSESSLVSQKRDAAGMWYVRVEWDRDIIEAAVAIHRDRDNPARQELKSDRRRSLSRVSVNGRSLIVKEYCGARLRWRFRPDRECWLNTYRLEMNGIPVGKCVGWLCASTGSGYVVQEDVGHEALYHVFQSSQNSLDRRQYLVNTARILARMHASGVAHRDMKTGNLMIPAGTAGSGELVVIDADAVNFPKRVGLSRRAKSLCQLIETWAPAAATFEKLRLIALYSAYAGLSRAQARRIVEAIRQALG